MKIKQLGRSGIKVSEICLGSMIWGSQNTGEEAYDQISLAGEMGVNFIDTAEMYPVNPIRRDTIGRTERIIGLFFDDRGGRGDWVIATKHTGEGMVDVRNGAPISSKTISQAIDGSLRRLKTDYIDLYQFNWPNRGSYMFRQNWSYDPTGFNRADIIGNMEDCLDALQREVDKGRIRAFGLCNESAWGTSQWLNTSERTGGPRPVTLQNEYSLLCRIFDTDLSELAVLEDIGLLAFSPLANGLLTGKYQNGAVPEGSRMSIVPGLGGRTTGRALSAVDAYVDIAERHGLDPAQMAIAWTLGRPFLTSTIIGTSSVDQLKIALGAADLKLDSVVLEDIQKAHRIHPMPY